MSDAQLRALGRRATATGLRDDGAAYLRGRLRSGQLCQEELDLAAYCWHEAARAVVGGPRPNLDFATRIPPAGLEPASPVELA